MQLYKDRKSYVLIILCVFSYSVVALHLFSSLVFDLLLKATLELFSFDYRVGVAKWICYTGPYLDLLILNEVGTQPIEDG